MWGGFDPWFVKPDVHQNYDPCFSAIWHILCVCMCVCVCALVRACVCVCVQTSMLKIIHYSIACRSFCKRNQSIKLCCLLQIRRFKYYLMYKFRICIHFVSIITVPGFHWNLYLWNLQSSDSMLMKWRQTLKLVKCQL
jgi:hypothetical protein